MTVQEEQIESIKRILALRGIELNISTCGACDCPTVSLKIDGGFVLEDESRFEINMIDEE